MPCFWSKHNVLSFVHRGGVAMSVTSGPSLSAFGAGAAAGFAVDLSLFPLDTIKTRLQSTNGFWASGGFSNIYRGLGPAALASVPGGALFFGTYENSKTALLRQFPTLPLPMAAFLASAVAECTACLVRVPADQVKQRLQVGEHAGRMLPCMREVLAEGTMFRGYRVTVSREIPFAAIQLTTYEFLKRSCGTNPENIALYGAFCGGLAAGVTTPIDVAKTRIMLHHGKKAAASWPSVANDIWRTEGLPGLFRGVVPRIGMISVGGSIFFFAYETAFAMLSFTPTSMLPP